MPECGYAPVDQYAFPESAHGEDEPSNPPFTISSAPGAAAVGAVAVEAAAVAEAVEAARPPKSEYSSRFGEPVPAFVTWLSVELSIERLRHGRRRGAGFVWR